MTSEKLVPRDRGTKPVSFIGAASRPHRVLSAAAIVAIVMLLVIPRLGTLGGDAVLDWLTVKGLSDGFAYGTPVGQLADHYGIEFPVPPGGFPDHSAWLHPRSPGLLALLTPLRFFDLETVSDWSRVIAGLSWVVLAVVMIPLVRVRQSPASLAAIVLATASAPVLMLLEFGPHMGVVAVLIGGAWSLSLQRDSISAGVLTGLATVIRPTFGFFVVALLLGRRPRSALTAAIVWLGIEFLGFTSLGIGVGPLLEVNAAATEQWLAVPTNGSLAAMASWFLGSDWSVVITLMITVGLVAAVFMRHRRKPVCVAGWLAAASVGALVASPVLWEQYMVVLLIPLAWAYQWLSGRGVLIASILVGASQVELLVVRRLAADGAVRGLSIAVATAFVVVLILQVVLDTSPEAQAADGREVLQGDGEGKRGQFGRPSRDPRAAYRSQSNGR